MNSTATPHPHISTPSHPHMTSSPLTRGPMRATLRPRGLPSSHPSSTLTSSHPHSTHRRSRSVDSIRHTSKSETTPTNQLQPHPLSSKTATRATTPTTRANRWSVSGGSNKENGPLGGGQNRGENVGPLKVRGSSNAPFKDRTNTSQITTGQEERGSLKGNSLSELTPPLNAARLRPIRQSTRTATVSHDESLTCHVTCSAPFRCQSLTNIQLSFISLAGEPTTTPLLLLVVPLLLLERLFRSHRMAWM